MRDCIIDIEDEWGAPWALVVALYTYKMENTGEAESIERCRVDLVAEGSPPETLLDNCITGTLSATDSDDEFFDAVEEMPHQAAGAMGQPPPYEVVLPAQEAPATVARGSQACCFRGGS